MIKLAKQLLQVGVLGSASLLLGCSSGVDDELLSYVDEIKARPGGRIEALPQIKPYETFSYAADDVRSPFVPDRPAAPSSVNSLF